jgi:hypothetical protein
MALRPHLLLVLLVVAIALDACGPNWQPVSVAQPRTLDAGTVLEFHAKDQLVRLHGVKFERDSLSGIPWLEHLTCDTCRVHYALADVSQARTGNPGATAWNILLPFTIIVGAFTALAYWIRSAD